ncbi:hypothetical protein, partial [Rhizobium aegyptiacum]|uniref:hypothetical protein n=1 Tax=Rhizobium aegyptiacum TaxID=1764550 RepID=UPI001ABEFE5D
FIHDFKHGISAISNHSIPLLSMKELISRALPTKKRWAVRRAHVQFAVAVTAFGKQLGERFPDAVRSAFHSSLGARAKSTGRRRRKSPGGSPPLSGSVRR